MSAVRRSELERVASVLLRHVTDPTLHSSGLVIETLTGSVDNSNRSFHTSLIPQAGSLLVFFRRQVLRDGDGITNAGMGRHVLLSATPSNALGQVDAAPAALYLAAREQGPELTSTTMELIPRMRRQQAAVELLANQRRPPRAA